MIVDRIHISLIRLPFRVSYGHKQKTHKDVTAIICQVFDNNGHCGLGESIPRTYVTGETAESVFKDAQAIGKALLGKYFASRNDLQTCIKELADAWPAPFPSCAFCCIDLAAHDCLAQHLQQGMGSYLEAKTKALPYAASIGLSNKATLLALLSIYRFNGIQSFKLKVGDEHDVDRLHTIKKIMGKNTAVFADANGAWSSKDAPIQIEKLAKAGIWAIEEPLHIPMPPMPSDAHFESRLDTTTQHNRDAAMSERHFVDYAQLRKKISIPIILDESLISPLSYSHILEHKAADILNIRLSKLGGYSLVSRMLSQKPDSMRFSFGAMVGESPILAAAGYFLGCSYADHLYIQGYSHRILHSMRFVRGGPSMKGGQVNLRTKHSKTTRAGLGLTIIPKPLTKLTLQEKILCHEKT